MQNQKNWNESSNADIMEEGLLLKSTTSDTNSRRSLTTGVETTLVSSDDFFITPQTSNISSNLFAFNVPTTMEPSILSTDYPQIESILDSSISAKDSLIDQTDSNSSVGSFSNPPHEQFKQYHQELPSIMEDSASKPNAIRQRRNSMPFNRRGKKRKLSGTGSFVAECDRNSSNSPCDMTRLGESSDVLDPPAWMQCYSPYRKKTASVVSSERGALLRKLFTEEEKQRFLASKNSARKAEEPKVKSHSLLGWLAAENQDGDVACTSSIKSSIFGEEAVLSKSDSSLLVSNNSTNLLKNTDLNPIKPFTESQINTDSSKAQLNDMITTSENLFLNALKNTAKTITASNDLKKTVSLLPDTLSQVATNKIVPESELLNLNTTTALSVDTKEFGLLTESIENQFVASDVIEVSSNISSGNYSNLEISDRLENLFSASQAAASSEGKQSGELPFILSDNLPSDKSFGCIPPDDTASNTTVSSKDSESLQQGISKVKNILNSSAKVSELGSQQVNEDFPLESLLEKEAASINIQDTQNVKGQDINSGNLATYNINILSKDAQTGVPTANVSESVNPQIIEAPAIDFNYLDIPSTVLEGQEITEHIEVQKIEPANLGMDYVALQKTLLQNSRENVQNDELIMVADELCKLGNQVINLEGIQEVPNVMRMNTNSENQWNHPDVLKNIGFPSVSNQNEKQMLNISSEIYNVNEDKPMTEVLTTENSYPVENSFATTEDMHFLPNSIPISNGELEMLSFYADLEAKVTTDKRTKNSSLEECPKTTGSEDTSTAVSDLVESECEINVVDTPEKTVLNNEDKTPQTTVAKDSIAESRRISSESVISARRSSSDSCERHNDADSSSSDESTKRKKMDNEEVHSDSDAERKTALKTFKKPFTVAKKSVDEKTAFKSVIQSYFGVRTALKTCGKAKGRNVVDKNGSATIISFQNNSDLELSPDEFSADAAKSISGSWSPLKDLSLLNSSCLCSSEEVPCLSNGGNLQLTCEAEDSIDGVAVPCTKSVSRQCLLTPSRNLKHRTFCDIHLTRLKKHYCCPRCGLFCTQGVFSHCSNVHSFKYGRENHLFHPSCFIIPDTGLPPSCPHCSKFSDFNQVQLSLIDNATFKETSQQSSSIHLGGVNLMSDSVNYQLVMSPIVKEKAVQEVVANKEEILPTDDLHTLLTEITKEKSLTLRPTGKCLFNPIKNGDIKKVMQLIVNGVDPNHKFQTHKNNTPLHIAAFYGFRGIVHLLLQYGASIDAVNDDLETPLILAVEKNHLAVVKCLILSGAQVEAKNENGSTAFHLAAKNNYSDIAKLLFDTGRFDVNIQDDDGWTPLVWACEHNYINLVQWLLSLKADPNIQDKEKNTALHWAACSGDCDILDMLLKHGCNITFVNERGDSALHVAARKDHYACVKLLLKKGASMDCINKNGETPNMCCDKGSKSFKVFKKYSSNPLFLEKISLQQQVVYRDISRGAEIYPIQAINEVDQEEFIMEFRYITRNCFSPDITVNANINYMEKCLCKNNCNTGSCKCTKLAKCSYDTDGRLVADFNMSDPPAIYECSKICHCPQSCINRVVQKGFRLPLQIFRSVDKGWGVRTSRRLQKGTFICEYIGEVITGAEVAERSDDSYLFDLESKGGSYCIDGGMFGNVARFINHSCEPNLVSIRVFVEHQDTNFPRIAFFAMRDIEALEELCFDYGTEFWVAKSNTVLCTCNSRLCKYSKDSIDDTLEAYAREKTAQMLNL